jgi:hypothetical protein
MRLTSIPIEASGVPADGIKKAASVQNTPRPLDSTRTSRDPSALIDRERKHSEYRNPRNHPQT